jgi:flagellar hook-length control protein FliK
MELMTVLTAAQPTAPETAKASDKRTESGKSGDTFGEVLDKAVNSSQERQGGQRKEKTDGTKRTACSDASTETSEDTADTTDDTQVVSVLELLGAISIQNAAPDAAAEAQTAPPESVAEPKAIRTEPAEQEIVDNVKQQITVLGDAFHAELTETSSAEQTPTDSGVPVQAEAQMPSDTDTEPFSIPVETTSQSAETKTPSVSQNVQSGERAAQPSEPVVPPAEPAAQAAEQAVQSDGVVAQQEISPEMDHAAQRTKPVRTEKEEPEALETDVPQEADLLTDTRRSVKPAEKYETGADTDSGESKTTASDVEETTTAAMPADLPRTETFAGAMTAQAERTEELTELSQAVDRAIDQFETDFRSAEVDNGSMRIDLQPKELGSISITLATGLNGVTAKIQTGSADTASLISNQVERMIQTMRDNGVQVESVDVVYSQMTQQNPADANSGNNADQYRQQAPTWVAAAETAIETDHSALRDYERTTSRYEPEQTDDRRVEYRA